MQFDQASYGIYAGSEIDSVTIRFFPEVAGRIVAETWHPGQHGRFTKEGYYELTLPYNAQQPHELLMDVLKFASMQKSFRPKNCANKCIVY